jgi:hypothetical protein
MRSVEVKLHRLRRIKRRKKDPKSFDHFARLYWRYHFKVYGKHVNLWGIWN